MDEIGQGKRERERKFEGHRRRGDTRSLALAYMSSIRWTEGLNVGILSSVFLASAERALGPDGQASLWRQ